MSLQFTHVHSFCLQTQTLRNLPEHFSTVALRCVTITWQQIFKGSLQVTIVMRFSTCNCLPQTSLTGDAAINWLGGIASRNDQIVDFYYPILSFFWKMISVSDPNPVSVEFILSVSENYPKAYCAAQHNFFVLCLFCPVRQNNCWSFFAFNWTLVEVVTWQVWSTYLA